MAHIDYRDAVMAIFEFIEICRQYREDEYIERWSEIRLSPLQSKAAMNFIMQIIATPWDIINRDQIFDPLIDLDKKPYSQYAQVIQDVVQNSPLKNFLRYNSDRNVIRYCEKIPTEIRVIFSQIILSRGVGLV